MKIAKQITYHSATLVNLITFAFLVTLFVMVFFYPHKAGEIGGQILTGFKQIIDT